MKLGEKVNVVMGSVCYSAIGKIIRETPFYWEVEYSQHRTFDKLWKNQKKEKKFFHKKNNLQIGYSRELKFGDFLEIFKMKTKYA